MEAAGGTHRDQRLERALTLVLVLGLAGAPAVAADRPDLRVLDHPPDLPESEPALAPQPYPSAPPPDELTVFWYDPKELAPHAFAPLSREVTGIFRAIGVRVRLEQAGPDTVFGERKGLEIPVILLAADPSPSRNGRRVLGLVQKETQGPRAVWAFLDNVRWTLGYDPRSVISPRERDELGLALARVVAHEVVHAVVPDEPHTASGLMHHSMDRRFLLGVRAAIDHGCARVFQQTLFERLSPGGEAAVARTREDRAPAP